MESNDSGTQLAESRPQFDTSLRVALPVNAPARIPRRSRDESIGSNAFSPFSQVSALALKDSIARGDKPDEVKRPQPPAVNMDHDAQIKTAIRDFSVVALSSKRAGNKEVEATSYVSLGVIYDNQGEFLQGIEQYKLYLQICEGTQKSIYYHTILYVAI